MGARAKNRENSSLLAKWCPLSTPSKADLSTCGILRFDERANFKAPFLRGEKPVGSGIVDGVAPARFDRTLER
jgi:hypothetical protein